MTSYLMTSRSDSWMMGIRMRRGGQRIPGTAVIPRDDNRCYGTPAECKRDAEVKMHFTEMLLLPCGIAVRTVARESVNFFRIPFA